VGLPGAREITYRALGHCARKLGDALRVRDPRWAFERSRWEVDLYDPTGELLLGHVYFDAHGELLADASATYDELLAAYDA